MSLFIGLPNLHIEDAAIHVYPGHISFESSQPRTSTPSVYLNRRDMVELGEELIKTAEASYSEAKIRTVAESTVGALVDRAAEALQEGLGEEPPSARSDDFVYELASSIVEMVAETLHGAGHVRKGAPVMSDRLYPHGQHPFWCELLEPDCGTEREPRHRGRTSTMFAQTDEARIQLQLVRGDLRVPAGMRPGTVDVILTLDEGMGQTSVSMSRDEAKSLVLLLSHYVDMVDRETRNATMSASDDTLATEMYAGDRR